MCKCLKPGQIYQTQLFLPKEKLPKLSKQTGKKLQIILQPDESCKNCIDHKFQHLKFVYKVLRGLPLPTLKSRRGGNVDKFFQTGRVLNLQ